MARKSLALLSENVNAALVLVGFGCLQTGIHHWSPAAAWVSGGVILMGAGAWPYLVRTLRKRA